MLKVVAKMSFTPEAKDSALPLVKELVAATVQEKGCLGYNFCQQAESTDAYAMIESWETPEALDAHMKSEHFTTILPQISALGKGETEIAVFEVLV